MTRISGPLAPSARGQGILNNGRGPAPLQMDDLCKELHLDAVSDKLRPELLKLAERDASLRIVQLLRDCTHQEAVAFLTGSAQVSTSPVQVPHRTSTRVKQHRYTLCRG